MHQGLINRYKDYLPVTEDTPIVTLNEGNTLMLEILNLPKIWNVKAKWYLKFEGQNPTGSFKDRGMTMAITKAKEKGAKVVMCASTGNTSAAAAAYAARAGMKAVVLIPEGKIALGKLSQAMMHGAIVLQIKGNFDDALNLVKEITAKHPIELVNSLNPYRIEGQKTGAFEIVDDLGDAPTHHVIPVGNAGNITAYWKGYKEFYDLGKCTRLPKMMGFQAEGAAPIVHKKVIKNPETVATAIRIGNPASWKKAEEARDESNGNIDLVSDDEITEAQKLLAANDGIFCEPASAASIAGVKKINDKTPFSENDVIVSILTGHGLKDPNRAIEISPEPILVDGNKDAILSQLSDYL